MIRSIRNTAFTDNKFSTICTNIPVTPIGGEECYSHVLRALVYPRDKENTYNLQIANSNYAIPTERNTVYLISGENALSWLGENKSDIIAAGFKQNELVSLFVSKQKDVGWAFIDENNNRSIIYSEKNDSSFGRMLACIVQKLFPATFAGKPLDNDELNLVKSISRNDENMFADSSQKLYDRLDLREIFIRSALSDIDVKFEKRSLERMKSEYTRIKSNIENLLRQIDDLYDKDHFNTLQIAALEEKIRRNDGNEGEFLKFFLRCKDLILEDADEELISFYVKGYLDSFDEDSFERCLNNEYSYFYGNYGERKNIKSKNDMKLFLDSVFGENPKFKIRTWAHFVLDVAGTLRPDKRETNLAELKTYLPHPHLCGFHCMGGNARIIDRMMGERNYLGAVEQAIGSTHNINFDDSTVGANFIEKICSSNERFIEFEDGSVHTVKEAMEVLKNG